MQLADPNGWLVGKFAPTVRKPVGKLPSGRIVTPLGDTAMALDPVGGQGANNGNKMARNLVEFDHRAQRPAVRRGMDDRDLRTLLRPFRRISPTRSTTFCWSRSRTPAR